MKLFIVPNVEFATWSYHSGGGVVVIAESLDAAKEYIAANGDEDYEKARRRPAITDEEWTTAEVYDIATVVPASMRVFPDAGCC